ncbi:unnamed protein product [Closterium sp. NIES-64]|nr:unnamed protein product [Closterium sp. NIES-64]
MLFMKALVSSSPPLIPSSHPFLSSLSSHPFLSSHPLCCVTSSGNTGGAAVWVSRKVVDAVQAHRSSRSVGFSRKVVDALTSEGISFGSFDILTDEAVRQGLNTCLYTPPTPLPPAFLCYVPMTIPIPCYSGNTAGAPVWVRPQGGGCSQVRHGLIAWHTRGAAVWVQRKVVDALMSEGISFGSFDILTDEAVRQGLKELLNGPRTPRCTTRAS